MNNLGDVILGRLRYVCYTNLFDYVIDNLSVFVEITFVVVLANDPVEETSSVVEALLRVSEDKLGLVVVAVKV